MTGRRLSFMLLMALLVSGVGQGGWRTPVPGLAQDTAEVVDMEEAVDVEDDANRDVADVSVFYEPLAPYGTWTEMPEYGQVWTPRGVHAGWRPYMDGRWVYTVHGWTWVSNASWGWAPFHYGRWTLVAGYGWVWVPGTVWGPAWVVWRHAPGWVGWAPLPPQVVFSPGISLTVTDTAVPIAPSWFCFVEERRILAPHVVAYIAPPARNVSLIQITQNVTHYTVIQNRVVNRSLPVERIERVIARPVPRLRIVEARAPEAMHGARVRERAREVVMFRPHVPRSARATVPGAQTPRNPLPGQFAPGTTVPQQQDTGRHLREQQIRERAPLEERQRHAPQPQSLQPEEFRRRHGAERRAPEDAARQERQQQLQQRQEGARQQARQQAQQQQFQQQQFQQQQQQRAMRQQQHQQPAPPQGVSPDPSQQQRAADAKEQRKKHQQSLQP